MKLLIYPLLLLSILSQAQTIPGQYPQASEKILKLTDIQEMDEGSLKLMRNEIFARYGYIFKNEDLKKHFANESWYKPTATDVTNLLTDIEKKNTDLIRRQENRIRTTGDFESFYGLFKQAVEKNQIEKLVELSHLELFGGEDHVREGFRSVWDRVKTAAQTKDVPNADSNSATLDYWERNDGTTVDYVEFRKIGPCWYIVGFGGAG
jgi:hypothetical protein